jgi:aspartate/methionine/tyrosine aminotransferase
MPRLPEDTTGASVFAALQGAIDARSRAGLATVPLHIGDTYVDPPPCARLDALVDMPEREAYVYGATIGLGALREAFASRQVRRTGSRTTQVRRCTSELEAPTRSSARFERSSRQATR